MPASRRRSTRVRAGRRRPVLQSWQHAEMTVYGVSFDLVGKQPIVLLKTADDNRFLPIWIGHSEAAAILMKLQGAPRSGR